MTWLYSRSRDLFILGVHLGRAERPFEKTLGFVRGGGRRDRAFWGGHGSHVEIVAPGRASVAGVSAALWTRRHGGLMAKRTRQNDNGAARARPRAAVEDVSLAEATRSRMFASWNFCCVIESPDSRSRQKYTGAATVSTVTASRCAFSVTG